MPDDKSCPDRTVNAMQEKSRRRSERVVLRIPVRLSALMPDGKRISIEAHTLVVNAHGGLLNVGMEMAPGQRVLLNNSKTEHANTGKVVRVERGEDGRFSLRLNLNFPRPTFGR